MLMQSLTLSPAQVQPIQKKLYQHRKLRCAVLRIDSLHPVVSGNKWFKLKGFLQAVADERKKGVITFGGPWSNHLLATAAACAAAGVSSIGLVRGVPPPQLSPTLTDAQNYGMQLHFLSRENYRRQELPAALAEQYRAEEWCMVPEGGYGRAGAWGAREILQHLPLADYTHILCAVGTGTTLAGLVLAAGPSQSVVGITVLKNADTIASEVGALLDAGKNNFRILHDYHFGGYAKKNGSAPAVHEPVVPGNRDSLGFCIHSQNVFCRRRFGSVGIFSGRIFHFAGPHRRFAGQQVAAEGNVNFLTLFPSPTIFAAI